jgi:hypothetical protein
MPPNPLGLNEAALDAIRSLQMHAHLAEADSPIWAELADQGLVELRAVVSGADGSLARFAMLTSLGRRYRTD